MKVSQLPDTFLRRPLQDSAIRHFWLPPPTPAGGGQLVKREL